jgi:hypothetical protein
MSHKNDDPMSPEQLQSRVYQGLQKKKKCSLCLQHFYVEELPGAITFKSILELRQRWGHDVRKGDRMPSPSQLYKREELCIFCMQFFDVDGLQDSNASTMGHSKRETSPTQSPANKSIKSNNNSTRH